MSVIETLIKSLHKDGRTARAIATELYDRGLKNQHGKFLGPEAVQAFLRHIGAQEPEKPPAEPSVVKPTLSPPSQVARHAPPLSEPARRTPLLKPWPPHTDFTPDELKVRD